GRPFTWKASLKGIDSPAVVMSQVTSVATKAGEDACGPRRGRPFHLETSLKGTDSPAVVMSQVTQWQLRQARTPAVPEEGVHSLGRRH
ncbi:MAG TPA: hypothetical protein VIK24_00755, partial [Pyrinomonadaceae bacterium]